jgi:hypothetical protein
VSLAFSITITKAGECPGHSCRELHWRLHHGTETFQEQSSPAGLCSLGAWISKPLSCCEAGMFSTAKCFSSYYHQLSIEWLFRVTVLVIVSYLPPNTEELAKPLRVLFLEACCWFECY